MATRISPSRGEALYVAGEERDQRLNRKRRHATAHTPRPIRPASPLREHYAEHGPPEGEHVHLAIGIGAE